MFFLRKILVTGALGQIGSELTNKLRDIYGSDNVVASGRRVKEGHEELIAAGPFEIVNINDSKDLAEKIKKHKVNTVINLAAILSAVGEDTQASSLKTCFHIDDSIFIIFIAMNNGIRNAF